LRPDFEHEPASIGAHDRHRRPDGIGIRDPTATVVGPREGDAAGADPSEGSMAIRTTQLEWAERAHAALPMARRGSPRAPVA
jgi:hypothetical protein